MSTPWIRSTLGAALLAGTIASVAAFAHEIPAPPAPPLPPAAPNTPLPPVPPVPPVADGHDVRKIIIIREHDDGKSDRQEIAFDRGCKGDTLADVDEKVGDSDVHRMRIRICAHEGESRALAAASVRHARDRIASDREMGAEIRERVLARLDAAIARLEREGR